VTSVFRFIPSLARLGLIAAALAIAPGCVSSRAFVPSEHVTGFSPDGEQLAAEYTLLEEGETLGDVKVWSDGAVRDGSHTAVRVTFEIANQSTAPLRFEPRGLFLEEMPESGKTPGRVRPAEVRGDVLVPAGQSRQLTATFALPKGVWPSDVPGYRVGWTLLGHKPHSRKTPFTYVRPREPDPWGPWSGPYYGYYPGFYGAWPARRPWPPPGRFPGYYSPYYYRPYVR
jgi:hypothetical protein